MFNKKCSMGRKKLEFDADFESFGKVAKHSRKKIYRRKSYGKKKFFTFVSVY
jgi:hypothetical protein